MISFFFFKWHFGKGGSDVFDLNLIWVFFFFHF